MDCKVCCQIAKSGQSKARCSHSLLFFAFWRAGVHSSVHREGDLSHSVWHSTFCFFLFLHFLNIFVFPLFTSQRVGSH